MGLHGVPATYENADYDVIKTINFFKKKGRRREPVNFLMFKNKIRNFIQAINMSKKKCGDEAVQMLYPCRVLCFLLDLLRHFPSVAIVYQQYNSGL